MKKTLFVVTLAFSTLISQPIRAQDAASASHAAQPPASKAKKLSRAEVDDLLSRPADVLFIDVRRPDEVSSLGGFPVYLSIQIGELENHLNAIPKDRLIVTVSNHAGRAGKAADLLESKGFKVAGAVGVENYAADGGHLTKIAVPAQTAGAGAALAAKK